MRIRISAWTAGVWILIALLVMFIVHLLILAGIVPYGIVWGGMIDGEAKLAALEGFALGTTLLFMWWIALKIRLIGRGKLRRAASIGTWIVFAYFLLNTIGNLASGVTTEKVWFAPVTIAITLLAYRVARLKEKTGD